MTTLIERTEIEGPTTAAAAGVLSRAFERLFSPDGNDVGELLLIRHAQPHYSEAPEDEPRFDPPLTVTGRHQAVRLATRLCQTPFDAIYASTMRRALETAGPLAAAHDLPLTPIDELREVDFDHAALRRRAADHPALADDLAERFAAEPRWDSLPGFEPSKQFRHRVIQAVEAILARHPGRRVAIVAHGGVINAYLSMLLGISRDMFFLPGHASISNVLVARDIYAVASLNDVAHQPPALLTR